MLRKDDNTKDLFYSSKYKWPVERLFGRNHWCVSWIMELCNADEKFSLHLIEQQAAYSHYLCVIRLALLDNPFIDMAISSQAEWLRTRTRKTVLNELYDPAPAGLLNILSKLGAYALPQEYYRLILDTLPDVQVQKYLRHKKHINKRDLNMIPVLMSNDALPSAANWPGKNNDFERLKYYARLTQCIDPAMSLEKITRSLINFRQPEQFTDWIDKQLLKASFPQPVWAGNGRIHPVLTAADLQSTASQFENCCYDYLAKILFGRYYFYISDIGPALVLIVRDPFLGWELAEISGTGNEKVPAPDNVRILEEFENAGLYQRSSYCWYEALDDYLF